VKGCIIMKDSSCCNNANRAIECTVKECKHHCANENYCSLNQIRVGTHETNPTKPDCTDCNSFQVK